MKRGLFQKMGKPGTPRAQKHWNTAADNVEDKSLDELSALREEAIGLRSDLNRFLRHAEERLFLSRLQAREVARPLHSDWVWRPDYWKRPAETRTVAGAASPTTLSDGLVLYHDCDLGELCTRQIRNSDADDDAPFALRMDVFQFEGSFLSLVLDLPEEGVAGLSRRHLVRLDLSLTLERPLEVFARLNLRHGPNTEQVVREYQVDARDVFVEFDLAYTELDEKRIERAWFDLIFEQPSMNQILIHDMKAARRPRAEL